MELIKENNKYNYKKSNGDLVSPIWFDDALGVVTYKTKHEFGYVKLNGLWNYINENGDFASDIWFKALYTDSIGNLRAEIPSGESFHVKFDSYGKLVRI